MTLATNINSSTTTTIGPGTNRVKINTIIIGKPGTTWVITLKDGTATKLIMTPTAAGSYPMYWESTGIVTIETVGATPGDMMVVYEVR